MHGCADLGDIDAELAGLRAVHSELVLDAGKGPRVVDLDHVIARLQPVADQRRCAVKLGRIFAKQCDLHVLAAGWSLFTRLDFETHGRNGGQLGAHGFQRLAGVEVAVRRRVEVQKNLADRVARNAADAVEAEAGRGQAGACRDRGDAANVRDRVFGGADIFCFFVRRQSALRLHEDESLFRLDIEEELGLVLFGSEPQENGKHRGEHGAGRQERMSQGHAHQLHIAADETLRLARVTVGRQRGQVFVRAFFRASAKHAAQHGQEDQRHGERGGQNEDQRDRQVGHELAGHRVPEKERYERCQRRQRGRDDGPEHPLA